MFEMVSKINIEVVNFTNVNRRKINGNIFSVLKYLKVLDLTGNPQIRPMIVEILISLRCTAIEELYLAGTCIGVNDTIDQVLENLQYLHIRVLSLDRNQIHEMQHVFKRLPHIENFTVMHNRE